MDDALHNNDLLVRYLDGDLTANEKISLEEKLRSDEALRNELANLKVAVQAVRHYGTALQVGAVHQEMMSQMKKRPQAKIVRFRTTIRYALAVAASVLVLFVAIRLFVNTQPSSQKIYDEAFVDFNLSAVRGSESASSEIENLYQQKNYVAVTTTTRSRLLSAKDSLLIGLAYMHTGKTAQAILFFEPMAKANSDFQQDAEFYLSLSYLKEKQFERAARLMKKIASDPSHLYHDQVTADLVKDVEELQGN